MAETAPHRYLDTKTLQRIARLDVRARQVIEGFINGQHQSPYSGFAVEFAGHREYTQGDDLRHVDWKVWSKTDRLYIKEYEEETNLKCTLVVDCSKSMRYGENATLRWSKFDHAATAAASLTYLLQRQQDAVGLVTFNNSIQSNLRANSHPSHLKRLVHELELTKVDASTDVADVFGTLASQIHQRGIVCLFSDLFVDLSVFEKAISQFRHRKHEVIVFHVMHGDELSFPFEDNTLFRGMEVDRQLHAEPRALRNAYLEVINRFQEDVKQICIKAGVDYVLVDMRETLDAVLSRYLTFRQRTKKLRHRG